MDIEFCQYLLDRTNRSDSRCSALKRYDVPLDRRLSDEFRSLWPMLIVYCASTVVVILILCSFFIWATRKTRPTEPARNRIQGKLPPIFPNGWIPIIESRDLSKGKAKSVTALGTQLAVFRTLSGDVFVLDAYCPHLGADLAVGGRVEGNCLRCPFHGWKFDGENGRCVSIPYSDRVPEVAKTKKWISCERNGFIHVWYHAEGDLPSWDIPEINEITTNRWVYGGRSETIVKCHIQDIPENGADINHLQELHTDFALSQTAPDDEHRFDWAFFLGHRWTARWQLGTEPDQTHTFKVFYKQYLTFFGRKVPHSVVHADAWQIGPATTHIHFKGAIGDMVVIQQFIPQGPFRNRIIDHVYSPRGLSQVMARFLIRGMRIMVGRDKPVWDHKVYVHHPIIVKEDKTISQFRRWFSQFYSEHSVTIERLRERSLDW